MRVGSALRITGKIFVTSNQQLLMQSNSAKHSPPEQGAPQTIIIACTSDEEANMRLLEQYGIHDR